MKRISTIVLSAAVAATLAGCGGSSDASSSSSTEAAPLETAAKNCSAVTTVDDGGGSLTFDGVGKKDESNPFGTTESSDPSASPTEDTLSTVACVLTELDTPKSVVNHMDSTRALDGMQEDSWSHYKARWTYHPDSGMNLTVVDTDVQPAG